MLAAGSQTRVAKFACKLGLQEALCSRPVARLLQMPATSMYFARVGRTPVARGFQPLEPKNPSCQSRPEGERDARKSATFNFNSRADNSSRFPDSLPNNPSPPRIVYICIKSAQNRSPLGDAEHS